MISRLIALLAITTFMPLAASAQTPEVGPGDTLGYDKTTGVGIGNSSGFESTATPNTVLYVGVGTRQVNGEVATSVHCYNPLNSTIDIQVRFRNDDGSALWDTTTTIDSKRTRTFSTSNTFYGELVGPGGSDLQQGSVQVVGTSNLIICSAELVDTSNNPATTPMPNTTKLRMMRFATPNGASQ